MDFIGYSEDDTDDEVINAVLEVNEPFIIKQKCTVLSEEGEINFYWGCSNNCSGWINVEDLAICKDRDEWLDAWKVDPEGDDFLVVTQDKIVLEKSRTAEYSSEVKLAIGTVLKLVPEEELPESIKERGTLNNYVVYLPTRDSEGNYVKKYALISQHCDVHVGFVPLTQAMPGYGY